MSRARDFADLAGAADAGGLTGKNRIINGSFQVWQRGTSSTSDGYQTADRFQGSSQNGAATMSQQSFTIGQTDVPGEPQFYYRHNQTTQATDYPPNIQHRIEGVRSLAGQKVTLSVYAKASKSLALKTYIFQHFGSGGSPSAGVVVENSPTIATLTTSWQRVTYTFEVDSISGKTLGTNGDDYLAVYLQFPTSDTYSVDLALLQLEVGEQATPFEHRSFADELARCQRYFVRWGGDSIYERIALGQCISGTNAHYHLVFPQTMRALGTLGRNGCAVGNSTAGAISLTSLTVDVNSDATHSTVLTGVVAASSFTAGNVSELFTNNSTAHYIEIDAEL